MGERDHLLIGATVLTAEPGQPVIEDAAIGIAAARQRMDLTGRVIMPGLVNIHTHAILTVVRGVADDMGFAPAYTKGVVHGHDIEPAEAVA